MTETRAPLLMNLRFLPVAAAATLFTCNVCTRGELAAFPENYAGVIAIANVTQAA